jgi:murein hydrolase activator
LAAFSSFDSLRRLTPYAAFIGSLSLLTPAAAQQPQKPAAQQAQPDAGKLEEIKQRDEELKALRGAQQKAQETEAALRREIDEIGADRRKLNEMLVGTAARVREVEAKVTEIEQRLEPLDEREQAIRESLDGRRTAIGEVLAALQRIGRRPPPALVTSPEDALQAVRTAIVLGAVLPEMRQRVDALAHDLLSLVTIRKDIAEAQNKLKAELADLQTERDRMNGFIAERQKQQAEREKALTHERARASDLAQKASDLKDLIAKLEQNLDAATRAAREGGRENTPLATLNDPGRLAPAVAFASLRGHIPIPVNGVKLKDFGDPDGTGGSEKGISIATRPSAQVTAPADGWVVYAGPFRSYGQLLILNVGGGYHLLLAGMDRISVDLGQFVLTGEPVAAMGSGSQIAAVLATSSSQPVLYIELRKDGVPVDPGPWWAAGEGEKVRG